MHLLLSGTYPVVPQAWVTAYDGAGKDKGEQEDEEEEEEEGEEEEEEEEESQTTSLGKFKNWNEFNKRSQATRLQTHDTLAKRRVDERRRSLQDIFAEGDEPRVEEKTEGGTLGKRRVARPFVVRPKDNSNRNSVVNFEGKEWDGVSAEARSCLLSMLQIDPAKRASADEVLRNAWVVTRAGGERKRA